MGTGRFAACSEITNWQTLAMNRQNRSFNMVNPSTSRHPEPSILSPPGRIASRNALVAWSLGPLVSSVRFETSQADPHFVRTYSQSNLRLAVAQTDTGPAPDVAAIHMLINQYTKAVDTVDPKLLSQIRSHPPEVSVSILGRAGGLLILIHSARKANNRMIPIERFESMSLSFNAAIQVTN